MRPVVALTDLAAFHAPPQRIGGRIDGAEPAEGAARKTQCALRVAMPLEGGVGDDAAEVEQQRVESARLRCVDVRRSVLRRRGNALHPAQIILALDPIQSAKAERRVFDDLLQEFGHRMRRFPAERRPSVQQRAIGCQRNESAERKNRR